MKYRYLKRIIASCIISSTLLVMAPLGASAAWIGSYNEGWYYTEGYTYATGWRYINGTWYFFDDAGLMKTGWINSNGLWYYADLSGAMQKGVIQIEGKIYLFTDSGAMETGSAMINRKLYNFNEKGVCISGEAPMPNRGFDYYGVDVRPYVPSQIVNSSDTKMNNDLPSDDANTVKTYKIQFKDDDGTSLKTRDVEENKKITLYEPTKSGYDFVEWNTKKNGDGTSYQYDDQITVKKDLTLYAQWNESSDTDTNNTSSDQNIPVTSIKIESVGSKTTITLNSTLQMTRTVLPSTATTQNVTWSVEDGTGSATISSTGRLTPSKLGTVTVKATATDGSNVYGKMQVTIVDSV
ncbi:InlB B-repeat-containing protein [Clostridium saccharobutylicum]|uniref:Autolysin n=1 Tax=Clostridium saccharobutylicum TaxID=169679 RepID=A0A1S8NJ36_CLOSA|nr:InlB B-repeat-containing protein [Clostridium saccharobutylicum]OOM16504.1 autolysin [Clostridium saccharobutylicum]